MFKLLALSDIHDGAKACAENDFRRVIEENMGVPKTFFIFNGDQLNCHWTKHPYFLISELADKYKGFDDHVDRVTENFIEIIKPIKDQILGLVVGNHELDLIKFTSQNPHRRICETLGVPDLGYSFFYLLKFAHEGGGGGRTVVIYGIHGWGGGMRTEGGDITKYGRQPNFYDFHIGLFGHTHEKWGKRIIRIEPSIKGEPRVVERPIIIANCGTFLKTLSKDETPTYSEQKGFPPKDIGYVTIFLKPDSNKLYVDLRVMC